MEPKPRAASYHRCSTSTQHEDLGREELRRAAQQRGFDLGEEIEEVGSGRAERPGWARVLDLARRGQVDVVVVVAVDRAGRSLLDLLAQLEALDRAGVRFISLREGLDLDPRNPSATSRLVLSIMASLAEFERSLIISRTRAGLDRARARGVRLGRPPAVGPTESRLVVLRREQGWSWPRIAREVGCSTGAVRRAHQRAAGKGGLCGAPEASVSTAPAGPCP